MSKHANTGVKIDRFHKKRQIMQLFEDNQKLYADNVDFVARIDALEKQVHDFGAMTAEDREKKLADINNEIQQKRQALEAQNLGLQKQITQLTQQLADKNREVQQKTRELDEEYSKSVKDYEQKSKEQEAKFARQIKFKTEEKEHLERAVKELEDKLGDLNTADYQAEVGFYKYANPALDSVELRTRLEDNKRKQKKMVTDKDAVSVIQSFTFNASAAKGKKFLYDMQKMALSLYNAEAENAVKTVKAGHLQTAIDKLNRCAERIEKFGSFINLAIKWQYQNLRTEELALTAQYLEQVQREKEEERERRAQLREEAKVQKELEAEMARLRKEQEHYQIVLQTLKEKGDSEEAEKLEKHLEEINKSIDDVDYRAANIRAGYVYVISDIGAFGENVVKIGMTRRLDPLERIRELSSASVPFKFDVHALFFNKDAVGLETWLHHEFDDKRVNKVNNRKEFFYATPEEVLAKLKEKDVAVVEYKTEAEAEEYRMSQAMAKEVK